jgi:hypothetical protein
MKAPRYILQVCGLTCEPQTAKGHSTLDSRVLPRLVLLRGSAGLVVF